MPPWSSLLSLQVPVPDASDNTIICGTLRASIDKEEYGFFHKGVFQPPHGGYHSLGLSVGTRRALGNMRKKAREKEDEEKKYQKVSTGVLLPLAGSPFRHASRVTEVASDV